MSDLWLYNPDICEGNFCPGDCDNCYKAELIYEAEEKNEID